MSTRDHDFWCGVLGCAGFIIGILFGGVAFCVSGWPGVAAGVGGAAWVVALRLAGSVRKARRANC